MKIKVLEIFKKIASTLWGVSILAISFYPFKLLAQNEYSLGSSSNVTPKDALDSTTPVDDFLPDEPKSLFEDESKTNIFAEPPTKPSAANSKPSDGARKEPQPSNAKSKLIPATTPAAKPASAKSVPMSPTPVMNQVNSPPPAAPALSPVVPVNGASSAMTNKQNFIAPLVANDGVAPIKQLQPGSANDFSGVPPLPGSRRNLAPDQAPEWYSIEAGDTLFDVCSQLIDDGNYWPRLWSLNPEIKNPHFIYPGMKIAFYPGDPENPPHIEVVEEEEMIPVDKGPIQETELIAQVSDIPKSTVNLTPEDQVIEVVGPEGVTEDESLSNFFESVGGGYNQDDFHLTLPAFIFENEQTGIGMIDSGHYGEIIAGDGIGVRIIEASNLGSGSVYSVLRYRGEIRNPVTGEVAGHRYDFSGNIRIGSKRSENTYDGVVQNSLNGLMPGDMVVPFISTKRHIDGWHMIGPSSTTNASVIGFSLHTQTFAGEGGVVFLDRGGLTPGSFFSVYQKSRFSGMPGQQLVSEEAEGRRVGVLRVVESAKNVTVAVIVKNFAEIRLGDRLTARE